MELPTFLGFAGDSINFFSAILLAWVPLLKKRVYLQKWATEALPDGVQFQDHKGDPILSVDKLDRVLVSGETNRARWGFGLLILGFFLLLVSRGLEGRHPTHPCPPGETCSAT